ncbi:MAG: SDR family oxidoreductase [Bacteroidetes bacterium]|nr:SDR family oxidoreductase [Bacteroidota bacterium]
MRTAIILGAKSDMAKALAVNLAKRKVDLVLAARNAAEMKPMKMELETAYHISVSLVEFDALNYSSHVSFMQQIPENSDAVFCVFGFLGNQELAEQNNKEMLKIIETNYVGAVSILELFASKFQQQRKGIIVGISSVAGDRGRQSNYFYGSSKAALTTYLSGLRNRLRVYNVQVLTVKPGYVKTAMTAHLQLPKFITATAEEVAEQIMHAIDSNRNEIYVLPIWRYIMLVIKLIPERIFKRMKL